MLSLLQSSGELASKMANVVINENTLVTKKPEIAKESEKRGNVNKRKRGRPHKFISTEQKTCMLSFNLNVYI